MPVNWFRSQQVAEAPIAPLSSQQAAARWEPSIQDFVTEIGGYTIDELRECIEKRWEHNFFVTKERRKFPWLQSISDETISEHLCSSLIQELTSISISGMERHGCYQRQRLAQLLATPLGHTEACATCKPHRGATGLSKLRQ